MNLAIWNIMCLGTFESGFKFHSTKLTVTAPSEAISYLFPLPKTGSFCHAFAGTYLTCVPWPHDLLQFTIHSNHPILASYLFVWRSIITIIKISVLHSHSFIDLTPFYDLFCWPEVNTKVHSTMSCLSTSCQQPIYGYLPFL